MNLHYSQTCSTCTRINSQFYYLMNLHYSQTSVVHPILLASFTTLWIYTILKPHVRSTQRKSVSLPYGFTLFSNNHHQGVESMLVSLPYGFTLFSNKKPEPNKPFPVSLPYGFTLFSNMLDPDEIEEIVSLPYGFTLFSNSELFLILSTTVSLPYGFTLFSNTRHIEVSIFCFTTLWIYTILKPQISYAHYTAQGKSTRSSTIVLWQNGIVKGAQIPIQHIEFGAHIYARRCLAL